MSRSLSFLALPLIAAAISVGGCNSGDAGAVPSGTSGAVSSPGDQSPTTDGTGTGSGSGSVGETCTSGDASKICLAMHFVTYEDSSGAPAAGTAQAATIIHTMNQLWAQCDIGFQIEKYEAVNPADYGLAYGAQSQNQLDEIRQTFEQPTDELLGVTTGPWGTAVNAWTNMPGDGIYGSVMEASIVDYGGGIIYAHEFGHYLGLDHVSDTSNLMNPVIYTTSTKLTPSQCQAAQQTATSYWSEMIRN